MALISALMLVTGTITVIPTAIAAQQGGGSGSGGNTANQGKSQSPTRAGDSAEWRATQTVKQVD